jgi:hypothetical protein
MSNVIKKNISYFPSSLKEFEYILQNGFTKEYRKQHEYNIQLTRLYEQIDSEYLNNPNANTASNDLVKYVESKDPEKFRLGLSPSWITQEYFSKLNWAL